MEIKLLSELLNELEQEMLRLGTSIPSDGSSKELSFATTRSFFVTRIASVNAGRREPSARSFRAILPEK